MVLPDHAAITRDWLAATLRHAGALTAGAVDAIEIDALRRKSFSNLLRIRIAYAPDAAGERPPSLVLKLARPGPAGVTMRRRRRKEHEFYAAIAPAMAESPAPRAYAASWDEATGRSHLLLEDCSRSHAPTPRGLPPTSGEAEAAVDRLASVHAAWWNQLALRDGLPPPAGIAARTRSARRLIADFLAEMDGRVAAETRRALREVAAAYPALLATPSAVPVTLLHGDSHPWNFLHPVGAGRTILLDWESWSIGAGPNDLVALIAMRSLPDLRRERERALVARYHANLLAAGIEEYDWDACWDDYRRGVARRLISPLRLRRAGSGSWQACLGCLALAYHYLGCEEVVPVGGDAATEDERHR
jgi:aminoglycoside phosphotransferase (APT) family kinase protein